MGEMRTGSAGMLGSTACIALLSTSILSVGVEANRSGALGWGSTASNNKGAAKPQVGGWQLVVSQLSTKCKYATYCAVVLYGNTVGLCTSAIVADQNAKIDEACPRHA